MIEITVWELTSFLTDECKDFVMKKVDESRDFLMRVDECRNFLMKIDEYRDFLMMKMKMIIWETFLLLTIHEVNVQLMIDEMILWAIAAFLE
jgi:hypothetical protein